jgi:hypothetical protein
MIVFNIPEVRGAQILKYGAHPRQEFFFGGVIRLFVVDPSELRGRF